MWVFRERKDLEVLISSAPDKQKFRVPANSVQVEMPSGAEYTNQPLGRCRHLRVAGRGWKLKRGSVNRLWRE